MRNLEFPFQLAICLSLPLAVPFFLPLAVCFPWQWAVSRFGRPLSFVVTVQSVDWSLAPLHHLDNSPSLGDWLECKSERGGLQKWSRLTLSSEYTFLDCLWENVLRRSHQSAHNVGLGIFTSEGSFLRSPDFDLAFGLPLPLAFAACRALFFPSFSCNLSHNSAIAVG